MDYNKKKEINAIGENNFNESNYIKKKEIIANCRTMSKNRISNYYSRGSFELVLILVLGGISSITFQNMYLLLLILLTSGAITTYHGILISKIKKELTRLNNIEKQIDNDREIQIMGEKMRSKLNKMALAEFNSLRDLIIDNYSFELDNPKNMEYAISSSFEYLDMDIQMDDKEIDKISYELDNNTLRRTRKRNNLVKCNYYKREK
ncbi:MAG: hypothetical protein ACI4WU_00415 [Bacilli bacterium]